ncbi:glycine--tRNA ligase subunit beta [Alteribacillus sp. HJP-4]|uniref:glycine--tRNA ligase subunit beta n=1 Tax=Alteribacillus sp. HJP-4 TaxID=2775394 RepID=UPI0035CCFD21
MRNKDYLLEIGLEEMPARFVSEAMNQLKEKTETWLHENRLDFSSVEAFSTPRRLAVRVNELAEKQADKIEEARGPAKKIALDSDGAWTKAALGFAKGQGISTKDLSFKKVKGTEYLFGVKEVKGKRTVEILPGIAALAEGLSFPKNMRWGSYSLRYVRPIHWIVSIFGNEIIPFQITDVRAGNVSEGHRFLGNRIQLENPAEYEKMLLEQYVIADPEKRKSAISRQLENIAEEQNWIVPVNSELLEEVNNLLEYPTALFGSFEEEFLTIPDEVLITSMKEHQRYFPVEGQNGELLPYFITVRNGNHEYLENVQKGNEKVLRARLSDARFFYKEDQKLHPDEAAAKLDQIVFQEELGSIGDKVRRLQALAGKYGTMFELDPNTINKAERAAALSKFDLVTLMVDEFTELQGLMGEKYARLAGESEEVAIAVKEHYMPRFSGDDSPVSPTGAVVGLADKLDTITACFGIGLIPTGSQDPYALRRQAAGAVKILLDHKVTVSLEVLLEETINVLEKAAVLQRSHQELKEEILAFFRLRLKNVMLDRHIRYDIADAVLENTSQTLHVMLKKAEFLQRKTTDPAFKETVESLSRVTNIAKKAENLAAGNHVDQNLFQAAQEKELYEAYIETSEHVEKALQAGNAEEAYDHLARLGSLIDAYFDHTMVMTDDRRLRENRLAQMHNLSLVIHKYARFSEIVFSS